MEGSKWTDDKAPFLIYAKNVKLLIHQSMVLLISINYQNYETSKIKDQVVLTNKTNK